jgi:hypothetical protein
MPRLEPTPTIWERSMRSILVPVFARRSGFCPSEDELATGIFASVAICLAVATVRVVTLSFIHLGSHMGSVQTEGG